MLGYAMDGGVDGGGGEEATSKGRMRQEAFAASKSTGRRDMIKGAAAQTQCCARDVCRMTFQLLILGPG